MNPYLQSLARIHDSTFQDTHIHVTVVDWGWGGLGWGWEGEGWGRDEGMGGWEWLLFGTEFH